MEENKNIEVDMNAFEEARYQDILNSNHYAELKILVGNEKESFNGIQGRMPCMKLNLHNINGETVSVLYASLMQIKDYIEKTYPLECIIAELCHNSIEVGHIRVTPEKEDDAEEEEKKDED